MNISGPARFQDVTNNGHLSTEVGKFGNMGSRVPKNDRRKKKNKTLKDA